MLWRSRKGNYGDGGAEVDLYCKHLATMIQAHTLIALEPLRLQVYLLPRTLLLRLAMDSRLHLMRRLRCRRLHCR